MKVYVDSELPTESCNGCPYCKGILVDAGRNKLFFCKANKGKRINNLEKAFNKCIVKNEFQSLADYTKQVRKEVLDQVYKVFTTESMWSELKDWWLQSGTCKELKNCLDAMVEETSIENIVKKFGKESWFYEYLDQIQGE